MPAAELLFPIGLVVSLLLFLISQIINGKEPAAGGLTSHQKFVLATLVVVGVLAIAVLVIYVGSRP